MFIGKIAERELLFPLLGEEEQGEGKTGSQIH